MAELSDSELAEVKLTSLIAMDESYEGSLLPDGDSEKPVRFVPCALKKFGRIKLVPGSAPRDDTSSGPKT